MRAPLVPERNGRPHREGRHPDGNLLERTAKEGPSRRTEISHQIEDDIYEFIQGRLRILWFYDEGRIVVCSHGFVKKTKKTPRRELQRAKETHRRYFEDKKKGKIMIE